MVVVAEGEMVEEDLMWAERTLDALAVREVMVFSGFEETRERREGRKVPCFLD